MSTDRKFEKEPNLEAAMLAESLSVQLGLNALLERLTEKQILGRADLTLISIAMSKAFELPEVRGNVYVQQIQRNTDEFIAELLSRFDVS